MKKTALAIVAIVVAVVAVVYYLLQVKNVSLPSVASAASAGVPTTDMGMTETMTKATQIGEQVAPTISGTTFAENTGGNVVGSGGYYDGMTAYVNANGVPVANTSTGATVGIPTSDLLTGLARNEWGGFIWSGTVDQIAAEKAAALLLSESLSDPDIQSKDPGVYTYGDYAYWNGVYANNGNYLTWYGAIPYTAEYVNLIKTGATQSEIDAVKAKSKTEMRRIMLASPYKVSQLDLAQYGVA